MLDSPSPRLLSSDPRSHPSHVLPESRRGEGRGEGQPHIPTPAQAPAPHPNPLPTEKWGEGTGGLIWRDGAFQRDAWSRAPDDGDLPKGPAILSKKRWLAERAQLADHNAPLGLQLEPGQTVDELAADLPRFALMALNFPKFSDGRAFSSARLLREKHGFRGELRAVGNVLSDQIPFMRRVGFDSFEVTHGPTRLALIEGRIAEVSLHYQPTGVSEPPAGTRPWLRRSTA